MFRQFIAALAITMAIGSLIICTSAFAQETHKAELFAGFSGRKSAGQIDKGWSASAGIHLTNQLSIVVDASGNYGNRPSAGQGQWTFANLAAFLQATPSNQLVKPLDQHIQIHSILAGPQFSQRISGRATAFGRALFGATIIRTPYQCGSISSFVAGNSVSSSSLGTITTVSSAPCNATVSRTGSFVTATPVLSLVPILPVFPNSTASQTETGFTFGIGGGLDVLLVKHWGVRVFQADYLTHPAMLATSSNDFRLSSGLLYQW